jgi:hypothetical protein
MKVSHPESLLVSWIGQTDLNAAAGQPEAGIGPIAQTVAFKPFSRLVLLSDYSADRTQLYLDWRRQHTKPFSRLVLLSDYSADRTQLYLDWRRQHTTAPLPLSRRIDPVLESQRR